MPPKAVVLFSGGLDSTVLACQLSQTHDLTLLAFDYGQQHQCELEHAERIARDMLPNATFQKVDISEAGTLLSSALTNGTVTDGASSTNVVPSRNAIMLSIAYGMAVSINAKLVATAVQGGDNAFFPDCRPEFIQRINGALQYGVMGFKPNSPVIHAPFISKPKSYIVKLGESLGIPLNLTWSCYRGGDIHCGTCGTCEDRKHAFISAGVRDATTYLVEA